MDDVKKQLQFIEEMMATSKANVAQSSAYYLLWGWLVFIAAIINYYLFEIAHFSNHWMVWPILMSLGGIASIVMGIKNRRERVVLTKIDKMLIYLWSGFIITLIVTLIGLFAVGPTSIYPVFMALYGMGTFVSGSILNFKPLKIGAVAAWVCATIGFYQADFSTHLILLGSAILLSYIIPGHLLAAHK